MPQSAASALRVGAVALAFVAVAYVGVAAAALAAALLEVTRGTALGVLAAIALGFGVPAAGLLALALPGPLLGARANAAHWRAHGEPARALAAAARLLAVLLLGASGVLLLVVLYALVVPRHVGERYGRAALAAYACHAVLVFWSVFYRVLRPVYAVLGLPAGAGKEKE
jgi:hypothetical protein